MIGSVGTQSGLIGSIIGNGVYGVEAWVAWMNANGGIDCHPIKYIVEDDGGDPSTQQSEVEQLVQQDHVIAMVQMDAVLTGQATVSYLSSQGIPVIGDEGGSYWFYQNPDYFPQAASGDPTDESVVATEVEIAKAFGDTKIGTLNCIEASICSAVYNLDPQFAQKFGIDIAYRGQASLTTPDFTSYCLSAKNAGVQVFGVFLDGDSLERLIQDCTSVGFSPKYVGEQLTLTAALPSDPAANGVYGTTNVAPWMETSIPGVAQFQKEFAQYGGGTPASGGAMGGWVSALIFGLAAEGMPATPTSQAVLNGLWKIKNDTLGGLTNSLTYAQGQDSAENYCYWVIQIQNGAYTAPSQFPEQCATYP